MTQVYWLEQTAADVPQGNHWLGPLEQRRLETLRVEKRRADWRLGRWTAKRAVAACLNIPRYSDALGEIEVRPAPSGAPEVFIGSALAPVSVSLSHREGLAVCAVSSPSTGLGCDLEAVESRIEAFAADYFTTDEQALVSQAPEADRFAVLALLWSAKESALKAMREGLRLSTLSLNVKLSYARPVSPTAWHPLRVQHADGQVFHGWWQQSGSLVRTFVASPPPRQPIPLSVHSDTPGIASPRPVVVQR